MDLDTTDGTVNVYVNQSADWKGTLTGDASRFVFGYLGTDTVHLTGMFRGTALAPNGGLKIELEGASNEGTFYGKDVTVGPNITIKKLGTPFLIGELKVSNDDICIGEQTEVSLTATEPGATTRIMGVVGDHQFVDFAHIPGPRTIYATVETADGRADFVSIPVNTRACAETPTARVALSFRGAGGALNSAEFMVRGYDDKGNYIDVARPASYVWDFGDGTKATTTTPLITHDYSASVDPLKEYNSFNVTVTVTNSQGTMTAKKVVPLWSLYAKNRSKGIVQPPSTVSDLTASSYSLQVKNHEPTPIAITAARTDFIPCDTNQDVQQQPVQAMNVAIPASATTTVNVTPPTAIPEDVCALGVHLMGNAPAGKVYSDVYMRVKENPQLQQPVTDPDTIALLNEASAVTKDPNRFDGLELRELVAAGKLSAVPPAMPVPSSENGAPVMRANAVAAIMPLAATAADVGPKEGNECSPGEVSDTPGLVCQPTPEWKGEFGQILNASKGHILMDHGCGNISQLLGAIHQNYSHTMIMSQNRSQVRHSTASEDRMQNALQATRLRLDPDAVRYGYPGTSGKDTYTIDQMATQYYVTDPDGKQWRMGAELSPGPVVCSDGDSRFTAVPSLVVKPPPDAPLDLQNAVASMADPNSGALFTTTGHYRFFMYSRADEASLYPGAGWAEDTRATVCSSFARDAAIGTMFNGKALSLFPTNPDRTVGISDNYTPVPDGMRTYTIDQRKAAANEEYANIHNAVSDACESTAEGVGGLLGGIVGGLFGGPAVGIFAGVVGGKAACDQAESNIANQVTNCFAFDGCDDTSDRWKNPGPGIAVSPDNILNWDVPVRNDTDGTYYGTYGYNEAMMYLPVVFRHKYVWKQTEGTGTLVVHVMDGTGKNPYPNAARVYVNSIFVGLTPGTGDPDSVTLPVIAAGTYDVEAQYNPCGESSSEPATVPHLPVAQLPACVAGQAMPADGCAITKPQNCQKGSTEQDCYLRLGIGLVCGCYPDPISQLACNKPLVRGKGVAVVEPGETKNVFINLCEHGNAACQQTCAVDTDCDNNLVCTDGKCSPIHQVVQISVPEIDGLVHDSCSADPKDLGVNFTVECDPQSEENLTDWICDGEHLNFCRDPITGGHAYADVDLHDNGHCNYMKFSFVCTMDEESGGVLVGADVRLLKGCGGEAEDEGNSVQWKALVVPATRDNPNPAPLVCRGETETTQGTCEDYLWFFSWHDNLFTCYANNAAFYKGGIYYQSLLIP